MSSREALQALLKEGERLDDLQRGGYQIIQHEKRFCFGMDAVLLAAFAEVRPGEHALDLGTGTGVIPILLHARTDGASFTGLEISKYSADMAARSVSYNHIEDYVTIRQGDIKEAKTLFSAGSFSVVTSNPPYMTGGHGLINPDLELAGARHEIFCTLEDVVGAAAHALKEHGRFYMVHRPFRLAEIMRTLSRYRLEPKRMRLVYPFVDKEPNMVLIEAVKGGRARISVERPLIVYEEKGRYTSEVRELYGMQEAHARKDSADR